MPSLLLAQRRRVAEVMDSPDLAPHRHIDALRGLERINRWSRSPAIVWHELRPLFRAGGGTARVLDVATGAGDVPIALAARAGAAGVAARFDGCDVSERAVSFAATRAARAGAGDRCRFFRLDALREPLPAGYDALICSLFLHHLSDEEAVELLRRMAAAADFIVINDLRRGAAALLLAHAGTRLLSRSDVVHTDGPLSVRAAFTIPEAAQLARRAGLAGAVIRRRWPQRFVMSWRRR